MATAKTSNRFDGGILNGSFEDWDPSIPTYYDATLTNATMVQLTREMQYLHEAGIPQVEMTRLTLDPNEPLVKDGKSAIRIYATSTWTARSVALYPEGLALALTGTPDFGLPWAFDTEGRFMFWARGTSGKQIELRLAMRDTAGTKFVYLNTEPGTWSTTATGIVKTLLPHWQQFGVTVRFPFVVDDGASAGENAGLSSSSSLVFGFFNVSTADGPTTDPFVFELDDLRWTLKGQAASRHEES